MEEEDEDFCRDVTDVVGIRQCFDDNGVVAVTGVLTKAECDATLADMGMPAVFDIRDPSTYALPEVEAALNPYGVVGKDVLWTKAIVRNRFHPNVASAYQVSQCNENVTAIRPFFGISSGGLHRQAVYGPGRLLACHDRAAIMRPTTGVGGRAMDTEFRYPGLHLDVDPQSFCTGDGADVRAFLDALHYDDDR